MPDIHAWASAGAEAISAVDRAVAAWRRIQDKPTSITIKRGTTTLDAQTVRIEIGGTGSGWQSEGGAGKSARQSATVFGVRDHPTEADTDIARDDRFAIGGTIYSVTALVLQLGEIQAQCEAVT